MKTEIIFVVEESQDGGYYAKALEEGIVTQADTISELKDMIKDAVRCHYENQSEMPKIAHLLLPHSTYHQSKWPTSFNHSESQSFKNWNLKFNTY